MPPWRPAPEGLRIVLRVTPRSSSDRIEGPLRRADGHDVLALRVRAVPDGGAANEATLRLVAAAFGLPPSRLTLLRGSTARLKEVMVTGETAALLDAAERLWPSPG